MKKKGYLSSMLLLIVSSITLFGVGFSSWVHDKTAGNQIEDLDIQASDVIDFNDFLSIEVDTTKMSFGRYFFTNGIYSELNEDEEEVWATGKLDYGELAYSLRFDLLNLSEPLKVFRNNNVYEYQFYANGRLKLDNGDTVFKSEYINRITYNEGVQDVTYECSEDESYLLFRILVTINARDNAPRYQTFPLVFYFENLMVRQKHNQLVDRKFEFFISQADEYIAEVNNNE